MAGNDPQVGRRAFLSDAIRVGGAVGLVGLTGFVAGRRGRSDEMLWQLDPHKCIACGNCATHCVLDESAVRCLHNFEMCGYCELCTGYFEPEPPSLTSAAENQNRKVALVGRSMLNVFGAASELGYIRMRPETLIAGILELQKKIEETPTLCRPSAA